MDIMFVPEIVNTIRSYWQVSWYKVLLLNQNSYFVILKEGEGEGEEGPKEFLHHVSYR